MSTLNFPSNPQIGTTYTLSGVTYTWNGVAWLKTNQGNQTFSAVTATNTIVVGTGTLTVVISNGSINLNGGYFVDGALILTTATLLIQGGSDIAVNVGHISNSMLVTISNTSTLQSVTGRGATTTNSVAITNVSTSTSTTTGALTVAGGVGIQGDLNVGGTVYSDHVQIAEAVFDSTYTQLSTTLTTVIDQYPTNLYRSAKYLIQIDEGLGANANFEVIELLLLVTNTGTVLATDYGLLTNNGDLGSFQAMVDGSNPSNPMMKLYFTANAATAKTITLLRTAVTI